MPEKDKIIANKIKQEGLFVFKDLYKFCYTWLSDEGYSVSEDSYSEKVAGDSKEIEIKWTAERKVSDYFKFQIKIEWFLPGMKDVEAEKMGVKIKMNKGSVELKASGYLIKDYEARWENSGSMKFLRGIYDQYLIKGRIEAYEDKLVADLNDFLSQVKSYLTIEGKH